MPAVGLFKGEEMNSSKIILPESLNGPRSYFTDLDPKDQNYNHADVVRKLKLQLLTKKSIVIAASSLFHDLGFNLCNSDHGLTKALQEGIIIPAVRNEFHTINDFYIAKRSEGYSNNANKYFSENTAQFVSWSLTENSTWFQNIFLNNVQDQDSLFRSKAHLSAVEASDFTARIRKKIIEKPINQQFLDRDDISSIASMFGQGVHAYTVNFANLIYRLSGARVVNSEGHFPQSNLVNLDIASNDNLLADFRIFWELYIEAVITSLTAAARLTPERLDSLSFIDILTIREKLFDLSFIETFDNLIKLAKSETSIHDPDRYLMKQEEVIKISDNLRTKLNDRIHGELKIKNDKSGTLMQVGSVIELFSGGAIFGTVSTLKAIPEITSLVSPKLADAMNSRIKLAKTITKNLMGWSPAQKKSLLSAYIYILNYGLPEQ